MSDFLNRQTLEFVRSGNDPLFSELDWIKDPDLRNVNGWPKKYWSISGDIVSLVDQATRDSIDTAEANATKNAIADELVHPNTIMRAFAEVILDEINILRSRASLASRTLEQLKTAVRGKL